MCQLRCALLCILISILYGTPLLAQVAEKQQSRITMRIVELDARIPASPKGRSGIVRIYFENDGDCSATMHFSGPLSFGGHAVLEQQNLKIIPSYFFAEHGFQSCGGMIADFDYCWTDNSGNQVLTGHYDVSQPPHSLEKNKGFSIYVPIKLPDKPGRFTLSTHFNNRHLSNYLHSMSISQEKDYLGCIDLKTEAEIQMPAI